MQRSVCGGSMPSAPATSWPCAQVSMIRAVAIDVGLIGGPYHGIFSPSGTAASSRARSARPSRQRCISSAGGICDHSSAPSSVKPSGLAAASLSPSANASGSLMAVSDAWSVQARWPIWWAMVQPSGVVTVAQPSASSGSTQESSCSLSAARSARTAVRRSVIDISSSVRSRTAAQASSTASRRSAVVAERRGEPEAAHEVEGALHEGAVVADGLVDAEQLAARRRGSRARPAAPAERPPCAGRRRTGPRPTARARRRTPARRTAAQARRGSRGCDPSRAGRRPTQP